MIKSHVVECASFTQTEANIKLPKVLSSGMKLAHLGVYGGVSFPANPILGMVNVVQSIELMDGATVLSSYTDNFKNYLEFLVLQQSNNQNRSILKSTHCSNYGMLLNNGGLNIAGNQLNAQPNIIYEGAVRPRVCIDKRNLKTSQVAESDSDLAVLDLSLCLGFLNAQYKVGNQMVADLVPCHLFDNLRLRIKFNTPTTVCANATTVAQPYLIFDEIMDDQLSNQFLQSKKSLVAQFVDYELEKVYSSAQTANNYLNGFYGKTLGKLVMMVDDNVCGSQFQSGEEIKFNINNNSLFALVSGVNHEGKKAMYVRQAGLDLDIPSYADRIIDLFGARATDANASADSIYEGDNTGATPTESNFFNFGRLSYLVLPSLNVRIDNLQLQYDRGNANAITMLFWAEVGKFLSFDQSTGATTVSYL